MRTCRRTPAPRVAVRRRTLDAVFRAPADGFRAPAVFRTLAAVFRSLAAVFRTRGLRAFGRRRRRRRRGSPTSKKRPRLRSSHLERRKRFVCVVQTRVVHVQSPCVRVPAGFLFVGFRPIVDFHVTVPRREPRPGIQPAERPRDPTLVSCFAASPRLDVPVARAETEAEAEADGAARSAGTYESERRDAPAEAEQGAPAAHRRRRRRHRRPRPPRPPPRRRRFR